MRKGMGSSSSTSSGGGNEHTGKLYFDPLADQPGDGYFITDAELRERLGQLVEASEKILEVRYYTNPLYGWQIWQNLLHHAYIVFETDQWWWSIEKNELGVTIQRSKNEAYVRDKFRRQDRTSDLFGNGIQCEQKYKGSHTLQELIDHIYSKDYLNEEYNVVSNNCKDFADKIYQFI
ncbi:uncharacterized protein LOC124328583 [Daphnia pulicaria]|uniref:uncharacterized protein LOC124328583 n=1 Tax=Daphnia pulicaria TaxID=35523 RepID=UPI001EEA6DBE|nr:uncharacterized protein LOC124328583 [Daphnia pulicaria]XP_046643392.1 uncharacterized protein LOC124328583 [Daphnia pulicaria]